MPTTGDTESSNAKRDRRFLRSILKICTSLVLLGSGIAKVSSFQGFSEYLNTSLRVLSLQVSSSLAFGIVVTEIVLGLLFVLPFESTERVVLFAVKWLFVGFLGWHISGTIMKTPACPCLGQWALSLNNDFSRAYMACLCVLVLAAIFVINKTKQGSPNAEAQPSGF